MSESTAVSDALHWVALRELTWSTRTRDAMGLKRRQSALVGMRAIVYNFSQYVFLNDI